MSAARVMADLLVRRRQPGELARPEWEAVISAARAEALFATLANWIDLSEAPAFVAMPLHEAREAADVARAQALWEAEMARRALSGVDVDVVLLKGCAYAAARLPCADGRQIGDLDILVPRPDLDRAEAALIAAGWEWVKNDPYDDTYYRDHMHELPPLIHKARDRMIDVHHSILPLTHRVTPDPAALLRDAVVVDGGFKVLAPADMLCHCAAHLIADGDLQGGLRNLWDFHRLATDFAAKDPAFWVGVDGRAAHHGLGATVRRAARLAARIFGTAIPARWSQGAAADRLFERRLLARDAWGRATWPALQHAFYVRSHWMRMRPMKLGRHLWTKWRKR